MVDVTRKLRKEKGLCPDCGKEYDNKTYRCRKCQDYQNKYAIKRRKLLKQLKICPVCGKNKLYGQEKRCLECSAKAYTYNVNYKATEEKKRLWQSNFKEKQRILYKERLEKGICTRCGKYPAAYERKKCVLCLNKDAQLHRLKR